MSSIKDAAEEIKKTVVGVRTDLEKATDVIADTTSAIRRKPIRRLVGDRLEERLDSAPILGQVLGERRLGRRRRGQ